MGKSRMKRKTPEMLRMKELIRETFFWPKMCDGLPHRSAKAIKEQLKVLFDPGNKTDGAFDPLTKDEERIAIQMFRSGMIFQEIADHFGRRYDKMKRRIYAFLEKQNFSHSERRKLWNVVCESLEMNTVTMESLSDLNIDWSTIGRMLIRCPKRLKNEWEMMISELKELCASGTSWDEAFEKVVPQCEEIAPSDFADFLDMFMEEKTHKDTLYCTNGENRRFINEMKKRGITGFKTGRLSEYKFCRYKMGRMFWAIRNNLLVPIRLHLPLSAQLRLVSRCVRTFADSPCGVSRVQLRRHLVVNELIRQMSDDDCSWKPSRSLRKYIEANNI